MRRLADARFPSTVVIVFRRKTFPLFALHVWQVSGLITTYRPQPTSLLSERGENVNFEMQDCEHFPGEAGISQHFIRKCIQLMTLRMRIFDKPLRRILTTVNSTISSNLWNSRQDWIGTSTTFLGNILGFFARNFHKSHTRNST